MTYRYCPQCASPLSNGRIEGDFEDRLHCGSCDFVYYNSPKVLVSCLATYGERLLWIKRGTEPKRGYWAIPGGFMEEGEQPEQAVERELFEETGVSLLDGSLELHAIGSLPEMNQVYLVYRAEMASPNFRTSYEASDVGLFKEEEAPWREQAYPALEYVTRLFYGDHRRQEYGIYCCVYKDGVNHHRDTVRASIPPEFKKYIGTKG